MSLDAICLRALVNELRPALLGARIDKVQQPARDRVVLLLRGNRRLLLCANPNQPRLQFTSLAQENPAQPPMFCMLLRKHLVGARIESVEQPGLERVVILTLHATDELGQTGERKLVLEAMGRRANLILLDGDGRILGCLRRVDLDAAGRGLLPGLFYRLPEPLPKRSPEEAEPAPLPDHAETPVDRYLTDTYLGLSPLIARELVQRAFGATDLRFADLRDTEPLYREIAAWSGIVKDNNFMPYLLKRAGQPVDFTYLPITQYGAETTLERFESFSALLDAFYAERERAELSARRGRELTHAASTARDRMARKAETLRREYAATQERDALRLAGDLITANLYRMERGMTSLTAQNYYDEALREVTVALDPLLTPQQNAAKYYKRYNKAKTAERHLREQIAIAERERAYLESVLQEIAQSETEQEFAEIRRELQETGYLRRGREKKELKRSFAPREFRSSAGLRILVGRSNVQNDQLTLKRADRRDLWLHTQKIHGSHVILCTGGAEPDSQSVLEAARLAAYYSQARESANVPVDYTPVKYVKKPAGARPGQVIYETYRTVYVTPEAGLPDSLKAEKQP